MSTYDRTLSTYGLSGKDHTAIADNTHFASIATNLFLPMLAEDVAPGQFDVSRLLAGNAKLYLAEAYLMAGKAEAGQQMICEYLLDHETDNLLLREALRAHAGGADFETALSQVATHFVIMHEIGHLIYGSDDLQEGRAAVEQALSRLKLDAATLREEAFCDLFGAINAMGRLSELTGLSQATACEMIKWMHLSINAIMAILMTEIDKTSLTRNGASSISLIYPGLTKKVTLILQPFLTDRASFQ